MPSQPCPTPGCPNLKPCPAHPVEAWKGSKRSGHNPTAWKRVRRAALARDGHRCVKCGAPANEVDHVVNRAAGGRDELANAQTLCTPCHRAKTQAEAAGARWA